MNDYTKGELYLVSEKEFDHIIYLRDKPNRQDKIVARFISKDDALLFLAAPATYEALKKAYIWMNAFMAKGGRTDGFPWMEVTEALAKVEEK